METLFAGIWFVFCNQSGVWSNILKITKHDRRENLAFSCLRQINLILELQFHAGKSHQTLYSNENGRLRLILHRLQDWIWCKRNVWFLQSGWFYGYNTQVVSLQIIWKKCFAVSLECLSAWCLFFRNLIRNATLRKAMR